MNMSWGYIHKYVAFSSVTPDEDFFQSTSAIGAQMVSEELNIQCSEFMNILSLISSSSGNTTNMMKMMMRMTTHVFHIEH